MDFSCQPRPPHQWWLLKPGPPPRWWFLKPGPPPRWWFLKQRRNERGSFEFFLNGDAFCRICKIMRKNPAAKCYPKWELNPAICLQNDIAEIYFIMDRAELRFSFYSVSTDDSDFPKESKLKSWKWQKLHSLCNTEIFIHKNTRQGILGYFVKSSRKQHEVHVRQSNFSQNNQNWQY